MSVCVCVCVCEREREREGGLQYRGYKYKSEVSEKLRHYFLLQNDAQKRQGWLYRVNVQLSFDIRYVVVGRGRVVFFSSLR